MIPVFRPLKDRAVAIVWSGLAASTIGEDLFRVAVVWITAEQIGNVIRLNFAASAIPPKPYESAEPPAWIQRAGLQWFHRLLGDPLRLWRRYLVLNPRFTWRVVRQRVGGSPMPSGLPVGVVPPHIGSS